MNLCHGHSCHVSLGAPPSDLWDRCKYSEASEQLVTSTHCRGGKGKAWEAPVDRQERGPAAVLAAEGRCGCQRVCGLWSQEEGFAVHICGSLRLCDRPETPACMPGWRALLQPVLGAHQVDPGWQHMAQITEQARPYWETCGCPGWYLHVGEWEDPRWGNSEVGQLFLKAYINAKKKKGIDVKMPLTLLALSTKQHWHSCLDSKF